MLKYISKSPHRILLEEKLVRVLPRLKGKILDVGSKNRRYDHLLKVKVTAIDTKPLDKTIQKGDITNLQFNKNLFDGILVLEVLEYVDDYKKAIQEINRVLKPGGVTLVSMPFMYKYHNDSVRFTKTYLKDLFESFSKVEIYPIGNFYTIILDIVRDKIIHLKSSTVRYFLYLPYFFLTLFIKPSKYFIEDTNFVSGYLILAHK